jgi:hypothetical protein
VTALSRLQRSNAAPEIDLSIKACPFCDAPAQIQYWHGGRPSKRLVSCSGDDCDINPSVTGETKAEAIEKWERRAP